MSGAATRERRTRALRVALFFAGAAALLAGLYGRFKGLGTWPLGVDEFYISRSIDNILHSGLPAFPCGGYYTRGLIYQYVVAGLRLYGWSPEYAGRFAAAVSSLVLLPAVWLLGKRVHSSLAGWLTVIILCLSVWEIEMARFGRMYAPFQALFGWYVLAYMRYITTRQMAALAWMIALSALGVLLWEGGVLLGVANLFAVLAANEAGKLKRQDGWQLAGLSVLLVLLYLATRDLRVFADAPAVAGAVAAPPALARDLAAWFAPLRDHPAWSVALAVPLALAVAALRAMAARRDRGLAAAGLCLVLLAAAVHAFLAGAGILVVMLLLRLLDHRALSWRAARYFWCTVCAFFVFWFLAEALTYGAVLHGLAGSTPQAGDFELIHQLIGFPAVYDHVLRPWLRTMPLLSLGVFASLAYLCALSISGERRAVTAAAPAERPDSIAVLSSLVIVLVLAIGATPTDRIETRYTFFLYPVLMVLAVCALLAIARSIAGRRLPLLATASVPLVCFAATEDFQPRHIAEVDSANINFRIGMPGHRSEHYYPRNDIRGAGQWLATEVRPGDAVITGIPSLDEYYAHIDYFFLDEGDARYEAYVCPDDKTERWTNLPVLYSKAALEPVVATHRRVFASVFASAERRLYDDAAAAGWSVKRVWTADSGTADVLLIEARPAAAPAP